MSDTKRETHPVWHCGGGAYWTKPVSEGDAARGIPQDGGKRIVINTTGTYDRLYIEAGYLHALTLGIAADYDQGKL